jgi:hypothetical protein
MSRKRGKKGIAAAWQRAEATFGDEKSTEFMITWTADETGVDYYDVVDWLQARATAEGRLREWLTSHPLGDA